MGEEPEDVISSLPLHVALLLEAKYRATRSETAANLHTAIAEAIAASKADVQTMIYVLELLKFEVMYQRYEQLFNAPVEETE